MNTSAANTPQQARPPTQHSDTTIRQQIYERVRQALGEPEISRVESGELYRWTLKRAYDVTMYITMDSPEHPNLAHIMISDSEKYQPKPVVSHLLYSIQEADQLIERIRKQWQKT